MSEWWRIKARDGWAVLSATQIFSAMKVKVVAKGGDMVLLDGGLIGASKLARVLCKATNTWRVSLPHFEFDALFVLKRYGWTKWDNFFALREDFYTKKISHPYSKVYKKEGYLPQVDVRDMPLLSHYIHKRMSGEVVSL